MRQQITARFSAPLGCGDRDVLEQRFEARVPQLEMQFTSDAPVEFTIAPSGDAVRARLLILLEEGGELTRTVEADDCDAAVEAIAFIAAVALDPGAVDPLKVRGQDRLLPDRAVPRKAARQQQKPPQEPTRSTERTWSTGIYGRAELGAGPEFLWGGGITIENSPDHSSFWAPSARLALGYVLRGGFEEEFGTARFELVTGGLDLCPSQARGNIFRLQACGTMEGGVLRAEGRDTYAPVQANRLWLGFGPAIFSEIRLGGPVGLTYRGAAIFPVIRDSFRFQDVTFHRVPGASLEVDAGISVQF